MFCEVHGWLAHKRDNEQKKTNPASTSSNNFHPAMIQSFTRSRLLSAPQCDNSIGIPFFIASINKLQTSNSFSALEKQGDSCFPFPSFLLFF